MEKTMEARNGVAIPPDERLPIPKYRYLSVHEIIKYSRSLERHQVIEIRDFEASNRNRKTLLAGLERIINPGEIGRRAKVRT